MKIVKGLAEELEKHGEGLVVYNGEGRIVYQQDFETVVDRNRNNLL